MTVEQMHIFFERKYQKKSQNRARGLNPEEIDDALNEAQDLLLDEIVNGFGSQPKSQYSRRSKRLAELRSIRRTVNLDCKTLEDGKVVYITLPSDFAYISDLNAKIQYPNISVNCHTVSTTLENFVKTHYAVVPSNIISSDTISNASQLGNVHVAVGNNKVLIDNRFASQNAGYKTQDDTAFMIENIIDHINEQNYVELFWEDYDGEHYDNSFILVSSDPVHFTDDLFTYRDAVKATSENDIPKEGTPDTNFDGANAIFTINGIETTSRFIQKTVKNRVFNPRTAPNIEDVHCKSTDPERIQRHRNHPFKKTNSNSILYDIVDDRILLFLEKDIYIDTVSLNYFKRPRRINKFSNIQSDLSESIQREIIDLAVLRLLQSVGSDRYQLKRDDQLLNNNN